jgi:hypothetical protein
MFNRGVIITEEERKILHNWVESSLKPSLRKISNNRLDYKLKPFLQVTLPENEELVHNLVWEIKERIIKKEGIEFYNQNQFLGDFLAYLPKDSFIHPHIDLNNNELDYIHTRFNVFIQAPKDYMKTYYANKEVDVQEGCYAISRSSIDIHYTEKNTTDIPRISLSFGFLLPREKVDILCKNMSYIEKASYIRMFNRGNILSDNEIDYIKDLILTAKFTKDNSLVNSIIYKILEKEFLEEYKETMEVSYLVLSKGESVMNSPDIENINKVRFDIWIQVPTDCCFVYYAKTPVNLIEGSYSLNRAGVDSSWITPNEQSKELIRLSFTLMLPLSIIDKITSNFNIDMYMNYPLVSR